jgi:D-3-phosphoglycerate dehydrogenase / 2-oxoglutarate reductase
MARFRVVVTDQVFPDTDVERGLIEAAGGELLVAEGRAEALELALDADALLNTYLDLGRDAIAGMRRAKIIARYGIGVDNIDLAAAKEAGIAVTNVPDYCVQEVATHTVALLLGLIRRVPQGDAIVRSGGWGVARLGDLHRLSALTVGLLGFGRIGRLVAAAVAPLGGAVLVHDPYATAVPQLGRLVGADELFRECHVVSVHCPLTPETRGMVNAAALATMPPGSFLVNTSRGPIVELPAVLDALRNGHLAGAALDVFDPEPPDPRLFDGVPNLLMTPHAAFMSAEALRESQHKAATQVLKALRGEPLDYPVR